ncbi:geranylgeranylglycerol-phosphate geranylgeranyltransferase [Psychroserpens sp.]|uniref:geranylgeranylglycerol-phosphate geranylgeranyltransferase n=1 Tax=Psychroserpens sp. TaxID=2020870 RepID=UPI001B1600CE|nr:geranylgeranylglycerol-phosphate geranylgeranyltransferase [Psychroserpens sp.]MBO6605760.1 geranylgeranylglycerol-phosphate geranylgeranyltransferase [Psychroserpens sp.]MBO6630130.1 geranylgeranylglycerol-phosphate geranylgeranyltransferase [Psychroserpens sp.]MBO6652869.1 geranylgeranylglycerol-phosphate geranylgeranyltransferase [Psychroserpens sp.]MBO6681359.1 geranylgeranylglycerol-phosphate geranylgeranyltransferase [Psychroserpens sp.]MBO6749134.1 geranylgeranylglycerol-phosphate ge
MLSRRQKHILLKFFSMFSVVRGYNILIVVIAQYLTSIYILAYDKPLKSVVFDLNLLMLVLASAATIAGGYIINNFYDSEKDRINRPNKSKLDRLVSQNTKLSFYFVLNFSAAIMASYVSFNAVIFFSAYIFGIWFYSHKLKKLPFIGNLTSAVLTILPFFAIFLYYKNFEQVIFVHAIFLFLMISMRELVKDLENMKGDLLMDYKTIPVVYGEKASKLMLTILIAMTSVPVYLLLTQFNVGHMYIFFYLSVILLLAFLLLLWKSSTKTHYLILHNILKFIIVAGVFCIVLINVDVVLNRIS